MKKVFATCAIITNKIGEVLLIKRGRNPFKNHWALISGVGETLKGYPPKKAVNGEVICDCQTDLIQPKELFTIPIKNDLFVDKTIVFTGSIDESKIQMHPPYSLEYQWVNLKNLDKHKPLAFEHQKILEKYIKTQ